jgi:predicted metal-dependent HD superfamily phosphohydrolase
MKVSKFKKLIFQAVELCKYYGFDISIETVIKKWAESHRYWHTTKHLYEMLDGVERLHAQRLIKGKEFDILTIAAVFHDIVYDPQRNDNA